MSSSVVIACGGVEVLLENSPGRSGTRREKNRAKNKGRNDSGGTAMKSEICYRGWLVGWSFTGKAKERRGRNLCDAVGPFQSWNIAFVSRKAPFLLRASFVSLSLSLAPPPLSPCRSR